MAGNNINYSRLIVLSEKVKSNTASKAEKDEYMLMLYRNGSITQQQYNNYLNGNSSQTEEVFKAGLAIGGILLVAYLISELFGKDKK